MPADRSRKEAYLEVVPQVDTRRFVVIEIKVQAFPLVEKPTSREEYPLIQEDGKKENPGYEKSN